MRVQAGDSFRPLTYKLREEQHEERSKAGGKWAIRKKGRAQAVH